MKQRFALMMFAAAVLFAAPALVMAQSYTANFTANPPTIDGVVSEGEWDAATAITEFTEHSSATESDPAEPTSVKILYSLDALYILYECTDTDVISVVEGSEQGGTAPGWTFAGTDYLAVYIDPANVANDAANVDPSFYSYSIQAEPSITSYDEKDDAGNSYNYTEFGRYGGCRVRDPNPVEVDGVTVYWQTGGWWDLKDSQIVDGPSADGYVMEWRIAWSDLNYPYYQYVADEIFENTTILDAEDATVRNMETAIWGLAGVDGGDVTGMPLPGTVWKLQVCRHSASASPDYINWVGDTSGFVSRPFGDLVFGEASASAVLDAILH